MTGPKLFTHHNQPYGSVTFTVDHVEPVTAPKERYVGNDYIANRAAKGWVRLNGVVVEGSETSRIFHHKSTTNLAGQAYVLEVPPHAYAAGHYTTVAM